MHGSQGSPITHEEFLKWQKEWRNKAGGPADERGPANTCSPWKLKLLETEDHPLFTLRRVRYQTQTDRSNTLLLSLPKKVSGRVPLLIALHGHEAAWGEADAGAFKPGHADDFCAYFAERGWAVLTTGNHESYSPACRMDIAGRMDMGCHGGTGLCHFLTGNRCRAGCQCAVCLPADISQ